MQRFGPPPQPGRTYIRRPGVYAILPKGRSMLVTFQGGMHNEFQLPGGGIDPGENPIQALYREVFEETGWSISKPKLFWRYRRYAYMPEYDLWAEKICTIYLATPTHRIGPPSEADHSDVWLPDLAAVDAVASPGDSVAVARYLQLP